MFLRNLILLLVFRGGTSNIRIKIARMMGCKIGNNCIIGNIDLGSEPYLITIGNKCYITSWVFFITHDGATWVIKNKNQFKGTKYGKIIVNDNVYIGNHCILLPNIEIGSNSIIGAGSVVTKNVPPDSVYAGNPARFICTLEEYYEKCKQNKGNLENSLLWQKYRDYELFRKYEKKEILLEYFDNKK